MKTINFRQLTKTPMPYNPSHGLYQCEDGSLLVLGFVPAGPAADEYFEKFRVLSPAMADTTTPMLAALRAMGAEVEIGQRMRRVGQTKETTNDSNTIPVQDGDNEALHSEGDAVPSGTGRGADAGDDPGVSK